MSSCSISVLLLSSQDLRESFWMKSLQVSPLCSWIPFSQIAWRSYRFCRHWLSHACVGGGGSEYIVWVVGRQTFTASNKKFCQALLLLSFLCGAWPDENSWQGKILELSLHKINALAVLRAIFLPALSQPVSALWELRCKTWEYDTHTEISPEP